MLDDRLIPARAGNTINASQYAGCASAHPRSRGEHLVRRSPRCCARGSSPLARGTHSYQRVSDTAFRLIPARAGNTTPYALSKSGF